MEERTLGRSGIAVSPMGLGCWAIGGVWEWLGGPGGWGEIDDAESVRAIHAALDRGVNLFDTAANYGTGHSERVLGKAIAGRRDDVIIATKFGFDVDEKSRSVRRHARVEDVASNLRKECEASLRRLGTDRIDLYQLHVWDHPHHAALEVRTVLEQLVSEGKIRAYGWSSDDPANARTFATGSHCAAQQHDLNVIIDAPEMLAVCDEFDLASINRSPLGEGALTGKYAKGVSFPADDVRHGSYAHERFFTPTLEVLESLREILTSNGRTLAQGALAWIWARSERTIPIPGFRTAVQVEENASAIDLGPLTPPQMAEIDALLDRQPDAAPHE